MHLPATALRKIFCGSSTFRHQGGRFLCLLLFLLCGPFAHAQMDSLLNAWMEEHRPESIDPLAYDPDFAGNQPDSVYIARLERMNSPISLPYNQLVRSFIVQYSERRASEMRRMMGRASYYMPIFEETFDRYGLPLELSAMAIIESNLNPRALSKAGARGMWQFTYAAAKAYGLEISSFVDERMDVAKSTDAAARYLRDAYGVFGDWALAICAYNCGMGGVRKAIQRAGGKTDYWSIYPFLPKETRNYVPAFVGALYTVHYAGELGLMPDSLPLPAATDTILVYGKMHLQQVSDLVGTDMQLLRDLNPQYKYDIIPENDKQYALTIPWSDSMTFIDLQDSIAVHKADVYMSPSVMKSIANSGTGATVIYKVQNGDNLSKIAAKHGVTVAKLKQWNRLSSDVIKPGQKLYIYK